MFKKKISKVIKCEILPITLANHTPVIMVLNLKRRQRETVWRLNNSLVDDQCFKEKIKHSMKSYFEMNDNGREISTIPWEVQRLQ